MVKFPHSLNVQFNHFIFYGQLQQSHPLPQVINTVLKTFYQCNHCYIPSVSCTLLSAILSIRTNTVTTFQPPQMPACSTQ